jgi:hypothetical protein
MQKSASLRVGGFRIRAILAVAVVGLGAIAFAMPSTGVNAATKKKTQAAAKKSAKTPSAKTTPKTAPKADPKTLGNAKPKALPGSKAVTEVKVESDTDHYYVLYAKPVAGNDWELPVAIAKGLSGTTVLTDGRRQLPTNRYRVETIPNAAPSDIDGDGLDDLTELKGGPQLNPLSAVMKLDFVDGVALIPDRATFEELSYQGEDVARDSYLAGLEYVKFYITKSDTIRPLVYVMNTETWRAHPMFGQATGISSGRGRGTPGEMRGDVTYYPKAIAPDGSRGLYRFAFQPNDSYSFAEVSVAYEALVNQMPFLASKFAYFPMQAALPVYETEKALYTASRVPVVFEEQLIN